MFPDCCEWFFLWEAHFDTTCYFVVTGSLKDHTKVWQTAHDRVILLWQELLTIMKTNLFLINLLVLRSSRTSDQSLQAESRMAVAIICRDRTQNIEKGEQESLHTHKGRLNQYPQLWLAPKIDDRWSAFPGHNWRIVRVLASSKVHEQLLLSPVPPLPALSPLLPLTPLSVLPPLYCLHSEAT